MELTKKVESIEPKRCFVFSQRFTSKNMRVKSIKDNKVKVNKETFKKDLKRVEKEVLKMSEKELDKIIAVEYGPRLNAYNKMDWYIGYVNVDEIGAWRGAGGVPMLWTKKSLESTAERIFREIGNEKSRFRRIRAVKIVPEMIRVKDVLKKERYLLPITLPTGTLRSCRKGMNKVDRYLDDGNMRAFAFAVSGDRRIKAYIGIKQGKQK